MRGRAALVVSIGLAVVAVLLMAAYVNGRERSLLQMAEMKDVVLATKDILPNTVIDERIVERVQVPAKYLQPKAVTDFAEAVGRVTSVPVAKGAQLLGTFLQDQSNAALAHEIPQGKRAVTIAVNDVTGVGGLIRPGNFVDVMGTFEFGNAIATENGEVRYKDERTETVILLQNKLVVAVGTDFETKKDASLVQEESPTAAPGGLAAKMETVQRRTEEHGANLTLVVSLAEARDLVLAQQVGTLSFVLRSYLETGETVIEGQNPNGLLNIPVPMKSRAKPVWREVRGSGGY